MDLSPPLSRQLRIVVLRLLHQGIGCAGEYGWTADDWAHAAGVPWEVLHAALEGRLIDEASALTLLATLGVELQSDPGSNVGYQLAVTLPSQRKSCALLTVACSHCHQRGEMGHQLGLDGRWQLCCASCQGTRPFSAGHLMEAVVAVG